MVICNFGCMNGLCLGSNQICGVVWNILVINGRLGGSGELGTIAHLVVVLLHDEAHQAVDSVLHILHDRKEDRFELFMESRDVSVG